MISRKSRYDIRELALGLSLNEYLKHMGFNPFPWQTAIANDSSKRVILLCSRQAGKSTFVSSIPCHTAKYQPGSLSLIIAPTEDQAIEDVIKVKNFIAHDPTYPRLVRNGSDYIELANKSRIIIVVATDTAARGYSKPRVVMLDEASRIPDIVYKSGVIPMMTNNPDGRIYMLSTPFGQAGFFYETWANKPNWSKYFVRTPWTVNPDDPFHVYPLCTEQEFKAQFNGSGIHAFFSPNHSNYEIECGNLSEQGIVQYQQEFCCDFVEMNGQVFSYEDMNRFFGEDQRTMPMPVHGDLGMAAGALVPKAVGGKYF